MRMKYRRKGIFGLLISSYIIFAISLVIALIITTVVTVTYITGTYVMPQPHALMEDPNSSAAKAMLNAGGWLEVLDEEFRVRAITGNKLDETMQYTQADIFRMLDSTNAMSTEEAFANPYRGFLKEETQGGEKQYLLVKIPRDLISVQNSIQITNNNGNSRYFFLFAAMFAVLFFLDSILLSLYLRRKIKKPLSAISVGMQQLQSGKEDVHLNFSAQMEFEEIRDAFNYMSERLELEKRAKAENEQKKNQLLLDLSHDIKTPISTIKAYANALEAGLVKPEEEQKYIHTIETKADRVNRLTEDLFTILKMDNTEYLLNKESVDISELVRLVCAGYYEEILQSGLELKVDIPDTEILASVDKNLMKRVFENILSNAIKYNKTGNVVAVRVYINGERRTVIEIADDGTTIAVEEQEQLFNAFSRGDKARSTDGGSGLGLAISKSIVEKHGGLICYIVKDSCNCFQITM